MIQERRPSLDEMINSENAPKSDYGELGRQFDKNTPNSSNLTSDEQKLVWRANSILRRLSPKSMEIIKDFVDLKRSVNGWNTEKKVQALTGVSNNKQGVGGKFLDKLFTPRQP